MDFIEVYNRCLSSKRQRPSDVSERNKLIEEFSSDRSRILYSRPFRRLQQKAQVFSLESNTSVRGRLTHSLEVSDVGRLISQKISEILVAEGMLNKEYEQPFIIAVESACLMHDIGNPPFGHFGEIAIQNCFNDKWKDCIKKAIKFCNDADLDYFEGNLLPDFLQFDGNPQGFRIVTRLTRDKDEFGLNLTYTTLMSSLKYVRSPLDKSAGGITKKPGFFVSEEIIVEKAREELGLKKKQRFPLAYIVESADDICYCISDIEDGIEKGIITINDFFDVFFKELNCHDQSTEIYKEFDFLKKSQKLEVDKDDDIELTKKFLDFKTSCTRELIKYAAKVYVINHTNIIEGEISSLFYNTKAEELLKTLKKVTRRLIFRSKEAEKPELAGYRIIEGLLKSFIPLMECPYEVIEGFRDKSSRGIEGFEYQSRLWNSLPRKHKLSYEDQTNNIKDNKYTSIFRMKEWFLRSHLIIDYISGMTDLFALKTYQLHHGIRID